MSSCRINALLFANISRCLVEIPSLGLAVYVHLSRNNFEMPISASGPIKYVPLFDNILSYLLLCRNPDFEVN